MIVAYIESNFILELARRQEGASYAADILQLAEAGDISLYYPSLAIHEPFSTLTYYGRERNYLSEQINRHLTEHGRSEPTRQLAQDFRPLIDKLLQIKRTEMDALEDVVGRILMSANMIDMNSEIFAEARKYTKAMSTQDAVVLASVMYDLQRRPPEIVKCFLNKNSRDFDDPAIQAELRLKNCEYKPDFRSGLEYLKHLIRQSGRPQR